MLNSNITKISITTITPCNTNTITTTITSIITIN